MTNSMVRAYTLGQMAIAMWVSIKMTKEMVMEL